MTTDLSLAVGEEADSLFGDFPELHATVSDNRKLTAFVSVEAASPAVAAGHARAILAEALRRAERPAWVVAVTTAPIGYASGN